MTITSFYLFILIKNEFYAFINEFESEVQFRWAFYEFYLVLYY